MNNLIVCHVQTNDFIINEYISNALARMFIISTINAQLYPSLSSTKRLHLAKHIPPFLRSGDEIAREEVRKKQKEFIFKIKVFLRLPHMAYFLIHL